MKTFLLIVIAICCLLMIHAPWHVACFIKPVIMSQQTGISIEKVIKYTHSPAASNDECYSEWN